MNGGATWVYSQVNVEGTDIECAALSMIILDDDRVLIAYQDDELYTTIKFAYSNDKGISWTDAGSIAAPHAGAFSPSPVKMMVMPSGKIRMIAYCYQAAGLSTVEFIDTTNNGVSWSRGNDIYAVNTNSYPDFRSHETKVLITNDTGVDATCEMIAVLRGDGGFPLFLFSTDGGSTWTNDSTTVYNPGAFARNFFYPFGAFSQNQPYDAIIHGTNVVWVTGYRDTSTTYKLQYITIPIADAIDNDVHVYDAVVNVVTFNASTLGASIDCGYPVVFHDHEGKLWCHYYDVSTEPVDTGITTDRCWIYQIKIMD
jgi:hypothetical protein